MTAALVIGRALTMMAALAAPVPANTKPAADEQPWPALEQKARIYAECGQGAARLLNGWIEHKRDPRTQLYSRGRVWNYENEAADHYSSLVLMAWFLEPHLNQPGGTLHDTLKSSIRLCTTDSGLPATYDLKAGTRGEVNVDAICEWLRDGLLRIVALLGTDNDFGREFARLTDALLAEADAHGGPAALLTDVEAQGNLVQVLTHLAFMSGETRYLEAAESLADRHLLGDPLTSLGSFSFVDHGCELVPGLAELFVAESRLGRPKAEAYREPLARLLDRLLEVGRHDESGLWYCRANLTGPQPRDQGQPKKLKQPGISGAIYDPDVPHCWGYVLFAYENYDRATGQNRYPIAIEKPMRWLSAGRLRFDELKNREWPWNAAPGCFGDSYESMTILWNRYREVPGIPEWLEWTTHVGGLRREASPEYGPGVGGHTDGCIGRNLCAHMMLQSQGVRALPYRDGLGCAATPVGRGLQLLVRSEQAWAGRLCFDGPRNRHRLGEIDWARINEMPQWYVVDPRAGYEIRIDTGPPQRISGRELIDGLPLRLDPGQARRIRVEPG